MKRPLDLTISLATRAPRLTVAGLLVMTVLMGLAATGLQVTSDLDAFAPDDGMAATFRTIDEQFEAEDSISVVVDAGPGGNVLTPEVLGIGQELETRIQADPSIVPLLAEDATDRPTVIGFASPFLTASEVADLEVDEVDDATMSMLVGRVLDDEYGAQASNLLSNDIDPDGPRARAGLVVLNLAAGYDDADLLAVTEAVESIMADTPNDSVRLSTITEASVERAVADGLARDLPVLVTLAIVLVVGVLVWLFRTVSDVLIGLVGLVMTMIWMAGMAALMGPGGLGITGALGQVGIAVPVLLVGLGIDYSVHLTARYREEQQAGRNAERAAAITLKSVGVALVLDTLATIGGFMANFATPLPPIADLGLFASAGILGAFAIMGLGVPAMRVLLDRRNPRIPARFAPGSETTHRRSRVLELSTRLATRRPKVVVGTMAALLGVAGVIASGLPTEFNNRQFLPEGSSALTLIDRIGNLFGGDVGEQTFVLVEGDPTDPALIEAVAQLEDDLADVDGVRRLGDRAQINSPFGVVNRLGDAGFRARAVLADDLDRWADPDAAAAAIELPAEIDPDVLAASATDADVAELPESLRAAIEKRLPDGRSALTALLATGDPDEIVEAARAQVRDAIIESRPVGLSGSTLTALAELPESELRIDRLESAGFPMESLSPETIKVLGLADRLADAGWDPVDPSRRADDLLAQLEIARDAEPAQVDAVLDDDGMLLAASTSVGDVGAPALAAEIERLTGPVRDAGGDAAVASEHLVMREIGQRLSDAQMLAIGVSMLVAAILLVSATFITSRSVVLGLIGITPAVSALCLTFATMRLMGLSINALTATVASLAAGIGVPYGIHLINRFRHAIDEFADPVDAIRDTLQHTGKAVAGSALTTCAAFGSLALSSSTPIRQFGGVTSMMITYAVASCLLFQPALLSLWGRTRRRGDDTTIDLVALEAQELGASRDLQPA